MSSPIWLKSPLRPSFAQYFPTFSVRELADRAEQMPTHLATQLTAPNIATYNELFGSAWWTRYLGLPRRIKAKLLGEVLASVGFQPEVVDSIVGTERDMFTSEEDKPVAFLNWTIPVKKGSALSAPGLVAHYAEDALKADHHNLVVEIGLGSGYHTAVLARLLPPNTQFVGFEVVQALVAPASKLLRSLNIDIEVIPHAAAPGGIAQLGSPSVIFITASASNDETEEFRRLLEPGGVLTIVRPLTRCEYETRPIDSWLHGRYGTYDTYSSRGWSEACVVTSVKSTPDDQFQVLRELYGVTFVPWRSASVEDALPATNRDLELLRGHSA